jgi:hypothetical protein
MSKEATINVLMLGARRAGKSTLLASLVNSMTDGAFSGILNAVDKTDYESGEKTLAQKIESIQTLVHQAGGNEISPDIDSTNKFKDYRIDITVPESSGKTTIVFTDGNGEFLELDNSRKAELEEKVASYDIILIAIDTPFLMEVKNEQNRLCRDSVHRIQNRIAEIQTVLSDVDNEEGKIARQIIFAPIKCEKWLHENRFDEVVERVMEDYEVVLTNLKGYKNIEIGVLPVQTFGNLEFSAHRKGYIAIDQGTSKRCSYVDTDGNGPVILATGEVKSPDELTMINPDSRMMLGRIVIPYSWYRIVDRKYSPQNCEMLAYHILRFAMAKTLASKKNDKINRVLTKKKSLFSLAALAVAAAGVMVAGAIFTAMYLLKRMGTIDLKKLETALGKMEEQYKKLNHNENMYMISKCELSN